MQKELLYNNTVAKYLNFIKGLNFFPNLLLILLFSLASNTYGQNVNSRQQVASPTIVLKYGAKLYSADDHFNNQILDHKIILKNSDVSYQENEDQYHFLKLVAKKSPKEENKDLKQQLKIAESKRQKEALKKVKKEIEKFEKRVQAFAKLDFNGFPSSSHFFSSDTIAKNYVSPSQNNHDFSKFYISADAYVISRALDFLHSQKYTYYNNKSLDFCYSKVFSVRPPPSYS